MACKYSKKNEIFENYLLNRLSQSERSDFETHLKSCQACKTKLHEEKWLLAGLREIGKQDMKEEIRNQVRLKRSEKPVSDWGMILKVAAVILFVVITPGLIYYYQSVTPELDHYAESAKYRPVETKPSQPQVQLEEPQSPGKQLSIADDARVNELKKGMPDRETTEGITGKFDIPESEEIQGQGDVIVGNQRMETRRIDLDEQKEKAILSTPRPSEESIDLLSRAKSVPISSQDVKVLHYEAETVAVAGSSRNSTFYQRETLSQLTPSQKIWNFKQAAQQIILQLQLSDTDTLKEEIFPEQLPAQIIKQDSLGTIIEWEVPTRIFNLDPNQITLQVSDSRILHIQLPANVTYQVDLRQKSQEALQVRP